MGTSVLLILGFPLMIPKLIKAVFETLTDPGFFSSLDWGWVDGIGTSFEVLSSYLMGFLEYIA